MKFRLLIHKYLFFFGVLFFIHVVACKEPFTPVIDTSASGYLAVEGNINSALSSTVIKLSRTHKLTEPISKPELSAVVKIVGESNEIYTLKEKGDGIYESGLLSLPSQKYQLKIKTANGKEYQSEMVKRKQTPDIDSISWIQKADGVYIYVNTHDTLGTSRYYKWTYNETWEIRAGLTVCWKSNFSSQIVLGSSAKLEHDRVSYLIKFIPKKDERFEYKYSIGVIQTALDINGYNFYQNLKNNTESNGSIFDRQPAPIKGNISCVTNPEELVLGNIVFTSTVGKRIFIPRLSNWGYIYVCADPENDPCKYCFYRGSPTRPAFWPLN